MKHKKLWITIGAIITSLIVIAGLIFSYIYFRYPSMFMTPNVREGSPSNNAIVQTKQGRLRGYIDDNVYTYHGVQYAQATERFMPAQPVESWPDVKDATTYGKISYQGEVAGMQGNNGDGNDNNSQNLNIWTNGLDNNKRPVMVWLHGGGFSTGSANESMYDGTTLAKNHDVVVVGVNHRLNVFGHLDLSQYGEKYKDSANVGLVDIQMALEWIKENIANFGGDPNNVTLFGQSGGGAKVLSMMTAPSAKGLFNKGIVQSGATEAMGVNFASKSVSERIGELTLQNLGIAPENVDEIQNVSYQDVMSASDRARTQVGQETNTRLALSDNFGIDWGPVIDGDYLPTAPVTDDGFAAAGKDVPLLIGSNFSEWTHMMRSTRHENMTSAQVDAFEKAYPMRNASDAPYVDTFIRLPMLKIMSHKADQNGAPVYAYVFNYGSDPYHGAEIPYVFDHGNNDFSTKISSAWVNFARNGVPSADGLPQWSSYTRDNGNTMILDDNSQLVQHHDQELMRLLDPDYRY
ncbi:carboxylesterase/lipase family protein [Alloscardovia theropitheci]|uniref:Carboxylic ester hydrolase n=1 Tax=Alloscardovia theropitheci TaxID=2496842 RepID=A0A4R0QSK4_9BIFI|nr:carboxylesterase family protein [Alloscardovia theropitheci]TCD54428.1 carboxylesterase/lipase family protein [Alloscardovia theropitheci]